MSLFDAIIIGLTLLLAIKGFLNGFVKEIAGLIGLVGGLILGSKYYHEVGMYINNHLFEIKNASAVDVVGFVTIFVGFWLFCIFLGFLLSKILKISSLGMVDKIFGFIFAGAKFFILISVILALLYQVEFLKPKIDKYKQKSLVLPFMLKAGSSIITLSPQDATNLPKNVKIPLK